MIYELSKSCMDVHKYATISAVMLMAVLFVAMPFYICGEIGIPLFCLFYIGIFIKTIITINTFETELSNFDISSKASALFNFAE